MKSYVRKGIFFCYFRKRGLLLWESNGNDVKFTADGILLSTNGEKGKVLLTNDGLITINGTEEISFWVGEIIQISADNKLDVSADSKVIIMSDGGGNITITEDSLDISGTQIHENVQN